MNRSESNNLRVDVYGGQRRFGQAGFCGIVKSADQHIIRYPFPHGGQRLKQIGSHKIIGADKNIWKRFHGIDHRLHFFQMAILDDESRVHRISGHCDRKIEGGIPLVERLAVVIIPDESDAGSPFCQHIIDKFRSFCNVIHI